MDRRIDSWTKRQTTWPNRKTVESDEMKRQDETTGSFQAKPISTISVGLPTCQVLRIRHSQPIRRRGVEVFSQSASSSNSRHLVQRRRRRRRRKRRRRKNSPETTREQTANREALKVSAGERSRQETHRTFEPKSPPPSHPVASYVTTH